jgi:hypothetical protein
LEDETFDDDSRTEQIIAFPEHGKKILRQCCVDCPCISLTISH